MLKLADILQNGLTDTLKLADIIKLSHDLDWLVYWLADMLKLTDILQNGLTDMLKLADNKNSPVMTQGEYYTYHEKLVDWLAEVLELAE